MYIHSNICADRRIGLKAEEAGAVLLTLNLLKHNVEDARRAAACLWVIQVFCSSGTQYISEGIVFNLINILDTYPKPLF